MSWEAAGALAQLLGALGVIASLLALACGRRSVRGAGDTHYWIALR